MKKLINESGAVVRELLEGLADLSPGLALLETENVVVRADLPPPGERKVAVISGGGSGHEPAWAGYVGKGLLTAAVAGDVFTSPSSDAVLAAIEASAGPAGALLMVKNYTDDRLNFSLAAELARRQGIPAEIALVADDVALRDLVTPQRRRGIAGTVLVNKIAGAAAEAGLKLAEIAEIARHAAENLGSMGVGLGPAIVPASGVPGFTLEDDEIELGLGIHGEKGVERTRMRRADELVDALLASILADRGFARGSRLALLVNGLGGTSAMELMIVARRALATLRQRGMVVGRAFCGNYLSSMEMPGVSLSVMALDEARERLLAAPADAPAWVSDGAIPPRRQLRRAPRPAAPSAPAAPGPLSEKLRAVALAVAGALDQAEPELTALDARAGDGDLGASMQRGAAAIRALPPSAFATPSGLLAALGDALRKAIAGSSGPFYATALLRAAAVIENKPEPAAEDWLAAYSAAVASVSELGGARPGDRTMIDALEPARAAWQASVDSGAAPGAQFAAAAAAATLGAARTADMAPTLGRAAYLGNRAIGAPDGGARAVAIWWMVLAGKLGE
jgi:ATP-dependent dihydroxyacetone kinase